jgi:hypothetical protein
MPDLERIQQATPGTLSQQWYEDGAAVDAGTVTIGITHADGTVLVAAGTPTAGTGTNPRTYNLTTTHTALVDRLTVTWTSTTKGVQVSIVEVAGGALFSISDLRASLSLPNTTTTTTADLIEMRTTVEQAIEQACGCAFVPRYFEETFNGEGGLAVFTYAPLVGNVPNTTIPFVTQVRSASIGGVAVTAADVLPDVAGFYYATTWPTGYRNIVIRYTTGAQSVPAEISRAALLLAKMWLSGRTNPIDDRAVTFSTTDGGSYSLAVPGRNGSVFGQPDIDAVVQRYSMAVGVA